ncbi:hypothetical protein FQN60_003430 [Etheostoma spectabile]|uniref:Uncharacterized protein n=2 Tax=Etheostoma spectabile TaxID=54343 RepID=A0A5J5C9Q2_9PERO|nr:hypothetical protein FQN60_003430 [Etheostoma spectabile]
MKRCHDYLHFTKDCGTWEEAVCTINCSASVSDVDLRPPPTVNATRICFTEDWCVTQLTLGLWCGGVLLLLLAVSGGLSWTYRKYRRRPAAEDSVAYTPAKTQMV